MHVVSGLIRKAPFIKSGLGPQGDSTMFAVELSEQIIDYKTQEKSYTNYKAVLFAKSPKAIEYYNKALSEGSFIVVSSEKLKLVNSPCGKYQTNEMVNAKLCDANFDDNAKSWGKPQQQQQQHQQQQHQQQQCHKCGGLNPNCDVCGIPF